MRGESLVSQVDEMLETKILTFDRRAGTINNNLYGKGGTRSAATLHHKRETQTLDGLLANKQHAGRFLREQVQFIAVSIPRCIR